VVKNFDSTVGAPRKLISKYKGPYEIAKVLDIYWYCFKDVEGFQLMQIPYDGIWAAHNIKPWLREKNSVSNNKNADKKNYEEKQKSKVNVKKKTKPNVTNSEISNEN